MLIAVSCPGVVEEFLARVRTAEMGRENVCGLDRFGGKCEVPLRFGGFLGTEGNEKEGEMEMDAMGSESEV